MRVVIEYIYPKQSFQMFVYIVIMLEMAVITGIELDKNNHKHNLRIAY